jgi:hypothetical protein
MVVRNLHIEGVSLTPYEAEAVLIVNADAVLALPITLQPFQAISRWQDKVLQSTGSIQHLQLLERNAKDGARETSATFVFPEIFRVCVPKRLDHPTY